MRIYFCRHAQEAKYPYKPQEAITDLGKRQALALGQFLSEQDIQILYSSDLPRALRTADIVGKVLNLKPKIFAELRELSTESPKGWTEYVEKLHPDFNYLIGGRESLNMLIKRTREAWKEVISGSEGRNIAVIGHGIFTKALLYSFGYKNHLLNNDYIPNTGVTILEYQKDYPKLIKFGGAEHLRDGWIGSRFLADLILARVLRRK